MTAAKMGRPPLPESERAVVLIRVRLRKTDAEALRRAAQEDGTDPAVWARRAILGALRPPPTLDSGVR